MKFYEALEKYFRTHVRRIRRDNMPILVRRGNRNKLADFLAALNLNKGAEIGTCYGLYAEVLCRANPDLHLYCVDPWKGGYRHFSQVKQDRRYEHAMHRLSQYNVTIIRKTSMDGLADFEDESLDFVYIDGEHSFDYVMADLVFWAHKVRSGGIIALHDYTAGQGFGVTKAVDAYTHCHNVRPWFVTRERTPSAFWVKR